MRLLSSTMLLGAMMLFINLKGSDCFNHHRDLVIKGSNDSLDQSIENDSIEVQETTTVDDDLVDSRENLILNQTEITNLIRNDSIENDSHLDSNETTIDSTIDSREHLIRPTDLIKRNAPIGVHPGATDDYYDDYSWEVAHSPEVIDGHVQPAGTVTLVRDVENVNDYSIEVPDHDVSFENNVALPAGLAAVQPQLVSHPLSDDWFLVKQYMDDYYFWELGDDLAREYFWHPVKESVAFEMDSAEKLTAEQFAQFQPVQLMAPWDGHSQSQQQDVVA